MVWIKIENDHFTTYFDVEMLDLVQGYFGQESEALSHHRYCCWYVNLNHFNVKLLQTCIRLVEYHVSSFYITRWLGLGD